MPRGFIIFMAGLVAILIAGIIAIISGHPQAALLIGNLGTLLWALGTALAIVTFGSRRRWPDRSWPQRLTSLLAFQR